MSSGDVQKTKKQSGGGIMNEGLHMNIMMGIYMNEKILFLNPHKDFCVVSFEFSVDVS